MLLFLSAVMSMSTALGSTGTTTCSCEADDASSMGVVWKGESLVSEDLEGGACFEYALLRNAVFGRHGWDPGHDTPKRHWLSQSFQGYQAGVYNPTIENAGDIELTAIDRNNIRLIQASERDNACDDWWDTEDASDFLEDSRVFVRVVETTWIDLDGDGQLDPVMNDRGAATPAGVQSLASRGYDWDYGWIVDGRYTCEEISGVQGAIWGRYADLGSPPMIEGDQMRVEDMLPADRSGWYRARNAGARLGCWDYNYGA